MNGKFTVTLHQPESPALCIIFMLMHGALQLLSPKGQKRKCSLYYISARHTAKTQTHSVFPSERVCVRVRARTSHSRCFDSSRWQEETLRVNIILLLRQKSIFLESPRKKKKEKKGKTTRLGFWFSFCLALHKSIGAMMFRGKVLSQKRKTRHCLFRSV